MNDPLTSLPLQEALQARLTKLEHPKLILLDIDNFSQINLQHSDEAGDKILCGFARALEQFAKENNLEAFRLSGDIFALVANMAFELSKMEKLIFSIKDFSSSQSCQLSGLTTELKLHMGICLDQRNLIPKALKALALSKKEDQPFVTYAQFVNQLLEEDEISCKQSIQTAIDQGNITPHFQPVLAKDKTTVYNEMLLRMELENSVQWPKFFLHVAQKHGLYEQILAIVLEKLPPAHDKLGINISRSDLFDEAVFTKLLEYFQGSNAVFEVHSYGENDPKTLVQKIKKIQEAGIRVCLENIQSIEDLQEYKYLQVDFIKVYEKTVRLLHVSQQTKEECARLLELIGTMGAQSIASHINSQTTLDAAKELGFECFQGFFLAKPSA